MQLSWRRVARLKLEENLETSFRYISYLLILLYRLLAITCPCMVHDDIVEILFANSFPLDLEYLRVQLPPETFALGSEGYYW